VAIVDEHCLEALREPLDLEGPGTAVAAETVDAEQGLSFSANVVVDLEAVQVGVRHAGGGSLVTGGRGAGVVGCDGATERQRSDKGMVSRGRLLCGRGYARRDSIGPKVRW
jgi:hypothetical protein